MIAEHRKPVMILSICISLEKESMIYIFSSPHGNNGSYKASNSYVDLEVVYTHQVHSGQQIFWTFFEVDQVEGIWWLKHHNFLKVCGITDRISPFRQFVCLVISSNYYFSSEKYFILMIQLIPKY